MRVYFACGGTGGHIMPALALADELKARHPEADIRFMGTRRGLDKQLVPQAGYPHIGFWSHPLTRKIDWRLATFTIMTTLSIGQALFCFIRCRPQAIVVLGGYASFSSAVAAYLLRIPILLHDENVIPGIASRIIEPLATRITIAFPGAQKYFKKPSIVTGNPLRKQFKTADRDAARRALKIPSDATVIVIMGGSQGARAINDAAGALKTLCDENPSLWVIHVTGHKWLDKTPVHPHYQTIEFTNEPAPLMAAADLAVSRSGAMSTSEIEAMWLPAIFIPYPHATDDHQRANAAALVERGMAEILPEDALSPESLLRIIREILDPQRLDRMKAAARQSPPHRATEEIIDMLLALIATSKAT